LNLTLATVDSHLYGVCSIAEILLDSKPIGSGQIASLLLTIGLP